MSENPYAAPQAEVTPPPVTSNTGNSPYGGYREVGGLGQAILVFLGLGALLAGLQIFLLHSLNAANDTLEDDPNSEEGIDRFVESSNQVGSLEQIVFLITIVLWCVWKNKSCKNAWLFRPAPLSSPFARSLTQPDPITPGWAVGSYFVPILNLWKPFQAMAFIRDQVSEKLNIGPLIGLWWTSWLVLNAASNYFSRNALIEVYTDAEAIAYNQGLMINSGIEIGAAFLAGAVIFKLTSAQQRVARDRGLTL